MWSLAGEHHKYARNCYGVTWSSDRERCGVDLYADTLFRAANPYAEIWPTMLHELIVSFDSSDVFMTRKF